MHTQVIIGPEPIRISALEPPPAPSGKAGAVVTFEGIVRCTEGDQQIRAIEYEAFVPMARRQLELLLQEAERKWPILSIRVIHRIGIVPVNETAFWVEVAASHRAEAFAACQFVIDETKRLVPIWKKPLPASPAPHSEAGPPT